jgi:hypothetical protein
MVKYSDIVDDYLLSLYADSMRINMENAYRRFARAFGRKGCYVKSEHLDRYNPSLLERIVKRLWK